MVVCIKLYRLIKSIIYQVRTNTSNLIYENSQPLLKRAGLSILAGSITTYTLISQSTSIGLDFVFINQIPEMLSRRC